MALVSGLVVAVAGTLARGHLDFQDAVYDRGGVQAVGIGLLDPAPHTGGAIDLATSIGGSLAVLAACLLAVRRDTYVVPLQAMGAMSLSVYVAHVLTAGRVVTAGDGAHPVALIATVTLSLVAATV